MNKATKSGIAVGIVIVLIAGWLTLSPYWTLSRMKTAIQSNDAITLNGYIDYPALRENLKADMAAQANASALRHGGAPAETGMLMAFAGPLIDLYVQPTTMVAMLTGRVATGGAPKARIVGDDVVVTRNSLTRFTVSNSKDSAGKGAGVVFEMHGLGWRMTRIALPEGDATGK